MYKDKTSIYIWGKNLGEKLGGKGYRSGKDVDLPKELYIGLYIYIFIFMEKSGYFIYWDP